MNWQPFMNKVYSCTFKPVGKLNGAYFPRIDKFPGASESFIVCHCLQKVGEDIAFILI